MSVSLESIISRLLVPDNTVLQQATSELQQLYKDPHFLTNLVSVLSTSREAQIRQYSAVLIRRKVSKLRQWNKQPVDIKQGLKQGLLQLLISEPEKSVKNSIAQIVGVIAKHELSKNQWPELLQFLNQLTTSNNASEREMGLFTFNIVASSASEQLKPHMLGLINLFSKTLQDSNQFVATNTIFTLTSLVEYIGTDEMNKFQCLIPQVMVVIRNLLTVNQEDASLAMDIFEELIESEVGVIVPHIKNIVGMCLEIASSQLLLDSARVKALSVISRIIRLKKKSILKHNLVAPILDVLFPVMCMPSPKDPNKNGDHNEDDDDDDEDEDNQSPVSFAPQVIDVMALHLPPEKLIPPLMKHLEPALTSNNPYPKKAGYTTVAILAEGCSEYIRNKYLHTFLKLICSGMIDESTMVRNSALFALGQFAEYLQPEVSSFHSELMPVLFNYLANICTQLQQGAKDPPNLTGVFFALETFCENLDEQLLPYLPALMEQLMIFLTTTNSVEAKELSISAIGAAANAAKEGMIPYFPQIIEHLKQYLTTEHTEETLPLLIQTIDTLGVFARTIGSTTFLPMARECMNLGLELIDKVHDPDLRRCVYGLFASISSVLGADMAPYMPAIIPHMIDSLISTEGIVAHYDDKKTALGIFDGLNDDNSSGEEDIGEETEEDEDDDDSDVVGHSVENSYLDEKEDTCVALRELALKTGSIFLPYFDKCFEEVTKLSAHPAPDVRKPAISALGQFCITLHKSAIETNSIEQQNALIKTLTTFLPLLISMCRDDTERYVVLAALETLGDLFNELKDLMKDKMVLEEVILLVKDTFKHKLACQDESEVGEEDVDEQEAEYDGMLLEFAGELIPSMAKALMPELVLPYLENVIPCLISKSKPKNSVAERSFSVGTLAETVSALGKEGATSVVGPLLPLFLSAMKDEDEEVRSNAVYGLGVLVLNAGTFLLPQYPSLLQALSNMLSKENDPRAKDNVCSAVARFIMANPTSVPLKQVLPVFLKCLPLQIDFEENSTVYTCIYELYGRRHEEVFEYLPQILRIISMVITSKNLTMETKSQLKDVTSAAYREFPAEFAALMNSMTPEVQEIMKSLV